MATRSDACLLPLAEAIGDEQPVDWQGERSDKPEFANLIDRLHRIEAVAIGFRGLEQPGEDDLADGEALFSWGRLEVMEKIGEGSFGEVFRASDPVLQREVALKLRRPGSTPDEGSGRRFIAEARRLARIRHDNVVAVHGADVHGGRVGLWTELVDGRTLEERLASDGPLGVHETVSVGTDLCRALAAVHAAGLVHGDVKTANVLREHGGRIVLTDFGSGTEAGAVAAPFGSPASIAPEILEGALPRPESDLYSLGVLLFKLFSGVLPVSSESLDEFMEAHRRGTRRSLRDLRPEVPSEFIAVIECALERDPEARFASAGEMERALTAVLAPLAGIVPEALPPRPWQRTRPLLIAALILISVAVGALMVGRRTPQPDLLGSVQDQCTIGARRGDHPAPGSRDIEAWKSI